MLFLDSQWDPRGIVQYYLLIVNICDSVLIVKNAVCNLTGLDGWCAKVRGWDPSRWTFREGFNTVFSIVAVDFLSNVIKLCWIRVKYTTDLLSFTLLLRRQFISIEPLQRKGTESNWVTINSDQTMQAATLENLTRFKGDKTLTLHPGPRARTVTEPRFPRLHLLTLSLCWCLQEFLSLWQKMTVDTKSL